jgi:hypothetical protein
MASCVRGHVLGMLVLLFLHFPGFISGFGRSHEPIRESGRVYFGRNKQRKYSKKHLSIERQTHLLNEVQQFAFINHIDCVVAMQQGPFTKHTTL